MANVNDIIKALQDLRNVACNDSLPVTFLLSGRGKCALASIELKAQADVNFERGELGVPPEWTEEVVFNFK